MNLHGLAAKFVLVAVVLLPQTGCLMTAAYPPYSGRFDYQAASEAAIDLCIEVHDKMIVQPCTLRVHDSGGFYVDLVVVRPSGGPGDPFYLSGEGFMSWGQKESCPLDLTAHDGKFVPIQPQRRASIYTIIPTNGPAFLPPPTELLWEDGATRAFVIEVPLRGTVDANERYTIAWKRGDLIVNGVQVECRNSPSPLTALSAR